MDSWIWAFFGGVVGAVFMDITEIGMARLGLKSGVSPALLGRWVLGWARGQFRHADIRQAGAQAWEVPAGWWFHFFVGGGCVALAYPVWFHVLQTSHWMAGLSFGVLTSVLPWFILLPSFGWGILGKRGPGQRKTFAASLLSHIPYGLGIAIIAAMAR